LAILLLQHSIKPIELNREREREREGERERERDPLIEKPDVESLK